MPAQPRTQMILIALGSNRHGPWGTPVETLDRAVSEFVSEGVDVCRQSSWYRSAPFGYVHQPDFVNGVIAVRTTMTPAGLLALCHSIEKAAGRRRGTRWGPRTLDLDLLAYGRLRSSHGTGVGRRAASGRMPLSIPHPGLAERPFVLVPLREIAPKWRHPLNGETAGEMLRRLGLTGPGAILTPI